MWVLGGEDRDPGSAYETHTPITIDIDGDTASSSCGQGAFLAWGVCGFPAVFIIGFSGVAATGHWCLSMLRSWGLCGRPDCSLQLSVIDFAHYLFSVKGIQEHCWAAGFFFFFLVVGGICFLNLKLLVQGRETT